MTTNFAHTIETIEVNQLLSRVWNKHFFAAIYPCLLSAITDAGDMDGEFVFLHAYRENNISTPLI